MEMDVPLEGGTEAVDEAHCPEAGLRAGTAALAQMGLDDAQQAMSGSVWQRDHGLFLCTEQT